MVGRGYIGYHSLEINRLFVFAPVPLRLSHAFGDKAVIEQCLSTHAFELDTSCQRIMQRVARAHEKAVPELFGLPRCKQTIFLVIIAIAHPPHTTSRTKRTAWRCIPND